MYLPNYQLSAVIRLFYIGSND